LNQSLSRNVLVEVAIVEDEGEFATLEAGLAGSVSARVTRFFHRPCAATNFTVET